MGYLKVSILKMGLVSLLITELGGSEGSERPLKGFLSPFQTVVEPKVALCLVEVTYPTLLWREHPLGGVKPHYHARRGMRHPCPQPAGHLSEADTRQPLRYRR